MFADRERYLYRKRQLVEVICQLRFPTILSISAREPAEFQEGIRQDFPQYKRLQEQPGPKVTGGPGNFRLEEEGIAHSVEPGIYHPGIAGVRIEDLIIVTKDGCEVLNHYPKDIEVIG